MLNIRVQRVLQTKSQKELAELVGISPVTLSRYETGKQSPTIETLRKMAEALNCTVSDLLGD